MTETKIKSINEIEAVAKELKGNGKRILTINGTFDILHVGHIKIIRDCLRSTCRDCGHLLLTEKERSDFLKATYRIRY